MQLDAPQMIQAIHDTTLLTRMFPEAKLAVVNALKKTTKLLRWWVMALMVPHSNQLILALPWEKGTEIAKSAADLILVDDDLSKMIVAVAAGRRIYTILKKAVQYIVSIHIPIILTVSLPLFFWVGDIRIFYSVHVIFLELVMGPMCFNCLRK
jgi:Ca2+-transporting ATPase